MPAVRTRVPPAAPAGHRAVRAWAAVAVGVLGISLAAPIGAATAAPALAVAFWRSAAGALATAPLVVLGHGRLRGLGRSGWSGWSGCAGAGALLAVHFALWLPSLRLTSVTASTALVTTTPVWTLLIGRWQGIRVSRGAWFGVGSALAGVVAVTGIDAGHGGAGLVGDLLAVAGGMASAGYVVVGERVRRTTSTTVYTLVAYTVCAVLLLPLCLVLGTPLAGWGLRTWIELGVLTVAAQLLGHTLLNAALPVAGATPVSLAILLEVPGAAVVAWVWLGVSPPRMVVPAAVLVLAGLVAVIRSRRPGPPPVSPA